MQGRFERAVELTGEQRERYSRQILFAGLGEDGQERLLQAQAAIVGCGASGQLSGGRVGARRAWDDLTIVDRDYVEPSNLQRQWLFEESDAAEALPKAVAAERRLARINSSVQVRGVVADLTPANVEELLGQAQVILDGTDNFETRYLVNDFALSRGIPWIYGAAVGSYGLTACRSFRGARRACAASIPIRPRARSPPAKRPAC
jgi:molybdopterin-synthase adenylyltransferase